MSEIIIPKRRMERRNTAAALAALNEVLLAGEWCLETDTRKVKFGDGVTPYNSLLYVGELANLGNPVGDRLVYWDDAAQVFAFLKLGTGLTIGSGGDLDASGGGGSGQAAIQFKDEGGNVGSSGAITSVNFVGSGISAAVVGTALTVTASGGGGGAMTLVGTATVAGSAATSFTMSGLDLDTAKSYYIQFSLKNATGSVVSTRLLYNGDTTTTNYDATQHYNDNTASGSGSRYNDAYIGGMYVGFGSQCGVITVQRDLDGRPSATVIARGDSTTNMLSWTSAHMWRTAGTNVTSITLGSAVANALAVGSFFKVWSVT